MLAEGVAAIVVLGGDGTHRAVAMDCGRTPIACVSTGTNNAFPDHREPTVTGLATGLAVTGRVPPEVAYASNKRLLVTINGTEHHPALVDVAIVAELVVGARALWRPESLRELYVTFADPSVIGLSAIAGFLEPVGRREPEGAMVEIGAPGRDGSSGRRQLRGPHRRAHRARVAPHHRRAGLAPASARFGTHPPVASRNDRPSTGSARSGSARTTRYASCSSPMRCERWTWGRA